MHPTLKTVLKPTRMGALAFAAALACVAGASHAGTARLSIDSFTATTTTTTSTGGTVYVWAADMYQDHSALAQTAAGLGGSSSDSHSSADWAQGANVSANTAPFASATGLLSLFTSDLGLATPGFNLDASTIAGGQFGAGALPHYANATSSLFGAFVLLDDVGNLMAGDITFEVFYSMDVNTPNGAPGTDYSQAQIDVLADDGDESFAPAGVGLLSTDLAGGAGSNSGSFRWTFNLGASDVAFVTLTGSAISSSNVPEPTPLALVALALGGLALQRRGARKAAAPALAA